MPEWTSRRELVRAPTTDAETAQVVTTSASTSATWPKSATGLTGASTSIAPAGGAVVVGHGVGLVLRRALGHHLGGVERLPVELALGHHLGAVLERVGDHTCVEDLDLLAAVDLLELVLEATGLFAEPLRDRAGHDESVELQRLALPL